MIREEFFCSACEQKLNPSLTWINPKSFTDFTKARSTFATLCHFCGYPNVFLLKHEEDGNVKILDRLPASSVYGLYKIRESKILKGIPERAEPINDEQ